MCLKMFASLTARDFTAVIFNPHINCRSGTAMSTSPVDRCYCPAPHHTPGHADDRNVNMSLLSVPCDCHSSEGLEKPLCILYIYYS